MRLDTYLQEARRNPEKNPRIDIVKAIEPYKDKKAYFMHFTDIPKLGINPKTTFGTPNGIYAYPVREMWGSLVDGSIPFRGDAKYVFLFKFTGKYLDVENYTDSMFARDVEKLKNKFGDQIYLNTQNSFEYFVSRAYNTAYNRSDNTSVLFKLMLDLGRSLSFQYVNLWNKMFRELGYDAVIDWKGRGVIHFNEPYQAVFFDIRKIQIIDMFENKREPLYKTVIIIKSMKEFYEFIIEKERETRHKQEFMDYIDWFVLHIIRNSKCFIVINKENLEVKFSSKFFKQDMNKPENLAYFEKLLNKFYNDAGIIRAIRFNLDWNDMLRGKTKALNLLAKILFLYYKDTYIGGEYNMDLYAKLYKSKQDYDDFLNKLKKEDTKL